MNIDLDVNVKNKKFNIFIKTSSPMRTNVKNFLYDFKLLNENFERIVPYFNVSEIDLDDGFNEIT